MVGVSSLLYFSSTGSDPDDPYNLIGLDAGETISSGILDPIITDTIQVVIDNRADWDAAGGPGIAELSAVVGSTASGTALLTGDTPTLSNNLDANGKSLSGIDTLSANIVSATTLSNTGDGHFNSVFADTGISTTYLQAIQLLLNLNANGYDITNVGNLSVNNNLSALNLSATRLDANLDANSKNITGINNLGATNLSENLDTGERVVSGTGTYRAGNLSGTEVTALTLHATDLGRNLDTQGYDLTGTGTYRATNVTATNLNATNLAANLDAGTNDITNIGTLGAADLLVTNGVTGTASGYGVVNIANELSSVAMSGYGAGDDLTKVATPEDQYTPMFDAVAGRMVFRKPVVTYGLDIYRGPANSAKVTDSIIVLKSSEVAAGGGVDLHLSGGLIASGGVSSMDTEDTDHNTFSIERDSGATYKNLLRATEGTITIQPEDDVHIKTNSGEDCARFNENAAVWLYYDDAKKIETHTDGVYVSGTVVTDSSSIQVSGEEGMKLPGAFSQVDTTDEAGENVASFYFPSGHAVTTTEWDTQLIEFNSTESYFEVKADGWYEGDCVVGLTAASVNITEAKIVKTTGWDGTEVSVARQLQTIHTLTDPHQLRVHAIFYAEAGDFYAFKFTSSSGNIVSNVTGNSAWIKRIA